MLTVVKDESAQDEGDGRSVLDEIAREGARRMLLAALETEVAAYLEAHGADRDDAGCSPSEHCGPRRGLS